METGVRLRYALEFDDGNEATEVGVRDVRSRAEINDGLRCLATIISTQVRPLPDFPEGAKVEWLQDDEDAWLPGVVAASEEIDDASDEGRPSWYGVDFDDGSGRKILASAVHLDVSETHAGDEIFNPGDVVQARWRHGDEWFAAKVEAVRSGDRYDVAFDDGWKEKNVHESYLRWPQIFKKGDVVDAFCFGREKLYRATVGGLAEISPDGAASYRLFYDDGEEDEIEARYMSLVARPFEAG